MSKKLAMASIVLLIIGGIALPGGFVLNTIIDDTVADEVDTGLTGIKDQATPIIESMVTDLGSAEVLSQIRGAAVPVIEDMVTELGVSEVLNQVNETAIPIVEQMVSELGVSEVLNQVNDTAIPIVKEMVGQIGVAESLYQIRETALPFVEEIVNATFLTQLLYNAYLVGEEENIEGIFEEGGNCLLNMFWDYLEVDLGSLAGGVQSFSQNIEDAINITILGVSEWYGSDIEFGSYESGFLPDPNPHLTLSWGDGEIPGVMSEIDVGTGILDLLARYDEAKGNTTLQNEMITDYAAPSGAPDMEWWKLEAFVNYYRNYFVPTVIPMMVEELQDPTSELSDMMPEYVGMDTDDIAYYSFLKQWANCSEFAGGMDFHEVSEEFPAGTYGFEVNRPDASGITIDACYSLWNEGNDYALTNMDAMETWFAANTTTDARTTLLTQFPVLTESQLDLILDWLWGGTDSFSEYLVPILVESEQGYGMPIADLAQLLFMEQWANGTILGEVMYEGGIDFGEMVEEIPEGSVGFEVGYPTPTNITGEVVKDLWDGTNPYSLFNMDGMRYWVDAQTNTTVKTLLINEFDLTEMQMDMILDWLWEGEDCFSEYLVPILVESEQGYGMPIADLAQLLFMEQWANGTILGKVLYKGGLDFGEMVEEIPEGSVGFEVGIPNPTNMTGEVVAQLWNGSNPFSLFNMDGMQYWVDAQTDDNVKIMLIDEFGLTETQMDMILDWLWEGDNCFSQKLVPILAESEQGYGVPISELAEQLLLEQWANGTILGEKMYEGGLDFHDFIASLPEGTTGFEVGIPDATGISMDSALALWNETNPKSLLSMDGMEKWLAANEDDRVKENLQEEFSLTSQEMDMILEWLWEGENCFSKKLLPLLIESDYGYGIPISEFSFQLLLEQWANGTIMGNKMYPEGLDFGDFIDAIPKGTIGFEVGIPEPTGMSQKSALALWDQDSDYALVSSEGLEKWWNVVESKDSEHYTELKEANFLTDKQMDMIIEWLPEFKDDVMPQLAKYEMDLPTDTTTLGNYVQFGGMVIGGACIGLASVGFMRNRSIKKKAIKKGKNKKSKKRVKSPSEENKDKVSKGNILIEKKQPPKSDTDIERAEGLSIEGGDTNKKGDQKETEFEFMQDVDYDEEMG
ncbi:MAG: hypothetical protein R6U96_16260 [Promethearchaeia archaeon]